MQLFVATLSNVTETIKGQTISARLNQGLGNQASRAAVYVNSLAAASVCVSVLYLLLPGYRASYQIAQDAD